MASKRGKAACNLALLIQRARFLEELIGEPADVVLGDKQGDSLLREHLERRSGYTFLDELSRQLRESGLPNGMALACLRGVVNAPGVALTRKDGNRRVFLQAVIMTDRATGGDVYLVSTRLVTSTDKPPEVIEAEAELLPVDFATDLAEVAEYLEGWWREFGVREITLPEMSKPKTVLWLGDPPISGYRNVPPDWEARLRATASVLGMRTQIVTSANQFRSRRSQLLQSADVILLLQGWQPGPKALDGDSRESEVLHVGTAGTAFSDLLASVREMLLHAEPQSEPGSMYGKRELRHGEIVYHRKVRSGEKYDHFDAGSSKPCGCNKKYVPWSDAPKASRGMGRRYSNFYEKDVQLKHCPRYPDCNMYAVERR